MKQLPHACWSRGQAPSLFAAIPEHVDPDAIVLPQGTVPAEGPGAPGAENGPEQPLPTALLPDVDAEELHRRRTTQELFKVSGAVQKLFKIGCAFQELLNAGDLRTVQSK